MALPDENDTLKQGVVGDSEDTGTEIEIDIIDDTPPEDRGRKALPEGEAEPTEDEMAEYSEAVQKRIRKMRHGLHDERRAKESAARERDEAVSLTQRILKEKQELEARINQGADAYVVQAKEKADFAMVNAKQEYVTAYEIGDAAKMADAQERMATIAAERREAEAWARNAARSKESSRQEEPTVVQSQPSRQPAASVADPDAQDWASRNKWFGQDKIMTGTAYGVHDELVEQGIDPAIDSTEYYQKLNARMRDIFPSYQWGENSKKKTVSSVVAPVNRTSKTARRVALTQSQLSVARRLGITPQQYAEQVAKLEQ